jgi:hypothetical protein
MVQGRKLTDIINTQHENVKYARQMVLLSLAHSTPRSIDRLTLTLLLLLLRPRLAHDGRYLPGIKLPANVVAEPDLIETVKDAHLLVWVLPHQVRTLCVRACDSDL